MAPKIKLLHNRARVPKQAQMLDLFELLWISNVLPIRPPPLPKYFPSGFSICAQK